MLIHGISAHVIAGNIAAADAIARICGLLRAAAFDAADAAPLPAREQRLVDGMWRDGVCVMFENLSQRHHGIEFSLFYNAEGGASPAAEAGHHASWLENVVQIIQFYNQVSVSLITQSPSRAGAAHSPHTSPKAAAASPNAAAAGVSPGAGVSAAAGANAAASTSPLALTPAASRILDLLKHALFTCAPRASFHCIFVASYTPSPAAFL